MGSILITCRHAALWVWLGTALLAAASSATLAQEHPAATGAPPNRVLELDGEGAYVELPVAAFEGLRQATLEAWVRWDAWGSYSQWFAYGTAERWRALGLNHSSTSTILQFFIYTGHQGLLNVVDVDVPVRVGEWVHLAAVSGAEGMRFYVNGVLVERHPYAGSFSDLGPGTHAYLGRSSWEENAPFHGALDEVRLWSVARDGEQIAADLNRGLRGDEPGLAGLWNFDAGDARDATPRGHHGRLRSGARCEPAPFPGGLTFQRPALVRGVVRDAGGGAGAAIVKNARVRLRNEEGRTVETSTRESGVFSLAMLDTGLFDLEILNLPTSVPKRQIRLVPGELLQLDLRPPPPSLVARWSADGDARDGIGTHDGTLQGEVTFAPGIVGQAFQFDGRRTNVIRVPWSSELNPEGSFTVVAWVNPTADADMCVAGLWGDSGIWDSQRAYLVRVAPGMRVSFSVSDDARQLSGSFHNFLTRPNVLALDRWSMVATVWDAEAGERRIYHNGVPVGRRTDPGLSLTRSRADFGIGGVIIPEGDLVWRPFQGRIDEVSLFDVALAEAEIQRLYSAHAQARWAAEGDAIDATASGHDGALVNGVTYAPGVTGQAFAFDGRKSYVELDPRIGNYGVEDFTVELWLWIEALAGPRPIISKRAADDDDALALVLTEGGHVEATLASLEDIVQLTSAATLSPRTWIHVALVRQGAEIRLYLDGELDGTASSAGIAELGTSNPLLLGGGPDDTSFAGRLDEVALHRRAMGSDEIRASYDGTLAQRSRRLWRARLQTGGIVAVGLFAVLATGRAVSQRRARRREREQLAEAERARQAADASNQAKSDFLANMSHEIRTPMNAIMGHAQVLRDEPALDEEQRRRSVTAICDHGDHLVRLIDDILDLSKAEAGRMELQPVDFDLGQVIDSLQVLFEVRCRQKGLRLRIEREGEAGVVRGDETKLRQVLVNLLGNAVKFTDEGEVVLFVSHCGGEYRFEVSDTGPGIAPEQQEEMFQPFRQGSSGLARGGTGLGLSIAQRHVALLGGRLEMASAPGGGVCFSFRVPLETVATAPAVRPEDVASFDGLALPPALRSRLREAAQMHNVTEVKRCLEQMQLLGEREARLAGALSVAVKRFDLTPLIEALETTVDG